MNRILILLIIACSFYYSNTFAQGWVLEAQVDINHGDCAIEKLSSANISWRGVSGSSGSATNSYANFTLYASEPGYPTGTLSFSASGTCSASYDQNNPVTGTFSDSYSISYTPGQCSSGYSYITSYVPPDLTSVSVTLRFYPQLEIAQPTVTCGQVTLTTTSCFYSGAYRWDVREPFGTWKTLSGKTSATINVTSSDLSNLGLTPYGKKEFQVTGLTGTTSYAEPVDIYYPAPTAVFNNSDPVCYNESTGAIKFDITGADAIINQFNVTLFKTSLSNPVGNYPTAANQYTQTITGLNSGTYIVRVQNNAGSTYGSCYTDYTKSLANPTQVTVSLDTSKYNGYAVKCNGGNTGQITATGSGGAGGYKNYLWNNGSTTSTATGLTAGSYSVSLTDSKGCAANANTTIHAPAALTATVTSTASYGGYQVSCWDNTDGAIKVTAGGGVGSYTYLWTDGKTSSTLSTLGPGKYDVVVKDANLCSSNGTITLAAPLPIDFSIQQLTSLTCAGDATASLNATGVVNTIGTATYAWSSGESTTSISNKGAGTYTLTVSDTQGCSTQKSKVIADPPAYSVSINPLSDFNGKKIKCFGDANGELGAVVKNASNVITTAQNYVWTKDGASYAQGTSMSSINSLDKGLYKVVITYNTNCNTEASYLLAEPTPVDVTITPTTYNGQLISCHDKTDGSLKATATGGTIVSTPYAYSWNTGVSNSLLSGIGAGNYEVSVTDNNGCIGKKSIAIVNPDPVEALITQVSNYSGFGVSCAGMNNGSITVAGSGGTGAGYTYLWSNGKVTAINSNLVAGTYNVVVSDNNGCQGTIDQEITAPTALSLSIADSKNITCHNGADGFVTLLADGGVINTYKYSKDAVKFRTIDKFDSLKTGSFTFTLKDANGCTKTVSTVLTEPTQIDISFTDIQPAFCNNPQGSATAIVSGGVGSYNYSWVDSQPAVVSTIDKLIDAKGDIYTLTVHDGNNCPYSETVAITSTDGAKTTYNSTDAKCFDSSDGSALVSITEGDGPFIILWPDGQSDLQGVNLKRGSYNVKITDAHNCAVIQNVIVSAPSALQLSVASETIPTCNTYCDGALTLQASGGVGSYAYNWNGKSDATQTQLCAGTYAVVVKDLNQCVLNQDVILDQPDPIVVSVGSETKPTCKDGCDGALVLATTGGNGNYQYSWSGGGVGDSRSNICPGTYLVSITDQKGCNGQGSVTLNNTDPLPVDLGGGVTLCVGQTYQLDAGSWPSIQWKSNAGFSSTSQNITIKDPGSYSLVVFDNKGCKGEDTFILETSFDLLQASFLIPEEAVVEDTIAIIDVSWPMPEKIEWSYPTEMKKVFDLEDVLFGQFHETGIYEVGLTAHLGECLDQVNKTITIIDKEEEQGGRLGYEDFVKTFTLYPSPSDGSFSVGVEVLEESSVSLSVWSLPRSILLKQVTEKEKRIYNFHFDMKPLSPGIYMLRLDHAKGKKYIRFVVE